MCGAFSGKRKNARNSEGNGKSGCGWHKFTQKACIQGKGKRHGKSGETVNRETANRDTTVSVYTKYSMQNQWAHTLKESQSFAGIDQSIPTEIQHFEPIKKGTWQKAQYRASEILTKPRIPNLQNRLSLGFMISNNPDMNAHKIWRVYLREFLVYCWLQLVSRPALRNSFLSQLTGCSSQPSDSIKLEDNTFPFLTHACERYSIPNVSWIVFWECRIRALASPFPRWSSMTCKCARPPLLYIPIHATGAVASLSSVNIPKLGLSVIFANTVDIIHP